MALQRLYKLGALLAKVARPKIRSVPARSAGPHTDVATGLLLFRSNDHQMAVQRLQRLGVILVRVAGQIQSVTDRRAFVQSSFVTYAFAKEALYWEINLTVGALSDYGWQGVQRLQALLRTLQPNPTLAASVKYLRIALVPGQIANDVVRVCTSLRALHWRIPRKNRAPWLPPYPVPLVPSHVRHLAFEIGSYPEDPFAPFLQEWMAKCLAPASGVRTLKLFTTLQTMSEIFAEIGPQIEDLRIERYLDGDHSSFTHRRAMNTVFLPLTNLKRLRMRRFRSWECRNVTLPTSLQRLILDDASDHDLQEICERLCDSSWCPNMQRLPLVERYRIPMHPLMEPVEDRMRRFRPICERAKAVCLERSSWLDGPEDFDRWVANFFC